MDAAKMTQSVDSADEGGEQQLRLRDIYSFLASQPEIVLKSLFESPLTCLAIFRILPPLARQYVLRMLYLTKAVRRVDVEQWARRVEDHRCRILSFACVLSRSVPSPESVEIISKT